MAGTEGEYEEALAGMRETRGCVGELMKRGEGEREVEEKAMERDDDRKTEKVIEIEIERGW